MRVSLDTILKGFVIHNLNGEEIELECLECAEIFMFSDRENFRLDGRKYMTFPECPHCGHTVELV